MGMRIIQGLKGLRRKGRLLLRDEDGVALVEFALVLPMMLVVFAVIVEGSRMMIGYQSAIAGVRDATRYLSRIVPVNICPPIGSGSLTAYDPLVPAIATQSMGNFMLPPLVIVKSVSSRLDCTNTGSYRVSPAPVVTVTAQVDITFPFAGIFTLVGSSFGTTPLTTSISDQSRVFGS
jgi:Flp pilus assembly pilin Flp